MDVRVEAEVLNPSGDDVPILVDFRIHFVKASGSTSPKVFKGGTRTLNAGQTALIGKTVSIAQHSTRTHYPGTHRVEVMLNGVAVAERVFDVV